MLRRRRKTGMHVAGSLQQEMLMELELYIKGALAQLPGDFIAESQFRSELKRHGLAPGDGELAVDKALLDGWVARSGDGLTKLDRARNEAVPGSLAKT
jgi:hypothetical protein